MTTLVAWVPGFLRTAFEGGPAGQRRVVLLAFVTIGPLATVVAAVLAGHAYHPQLAVRNVALALIIIWLLVRKPPSAAEWVILWTLLVAAWVVVQLAVGPTYSGVYALNGLAMLTLVSLVFDTWLVAYAVVMGIAGYAWVQLDFHPVPQAIAAIAMFAVAELLLTIVVHGTAAFLRDSLRDVGVLHTRMVQAADAERSRISGELHDDTVQVLTAVGLRVDTLIRRMERGQTAESMAAAQEARRMVGDATERTRRLSFNLYPPQLDHRGLGPALDALGNELSRDEALVIHVSAPDTRYAPEVERLAYRTIRELLLNAHRHASANRVHVSIEPGATTVRCEVRDDGQGFDAGAPWPPPGLTSTPGWTPPPTASACAAAGSRSPAPRWRARRRGSRSRWRSPTPPNRPPDYPSLWFTSSMLWPSRENTLV